MSQAMDISELSFAREYLLRPFTGHRKRLRECTKKLNDLRNVVVVFTILGARLGVEEVVACDKFEDLTQSALKLCFGLHGKLTMQAMLQTSVLAPHLAPRMTSGDRYCLVWISFVKWCPTQHAFPRSAIFTEIMSMSISSWLDGFEGADLFRDIPDIVCDRFSLHVN